MGQITFRLSDEDIEFLKFVSKKTGTPVSSLYRETTIDAFKEWKLKYLVDLYSEGGIRIKELCDLANITIHEGLLLLEKHEIEPPIPELVDDYTTSTALGMETVDIFKKKKRNSG